MMRSVAVWMVISVMSIVAAAAEAQPPPAVILQPAGGATAFDTTASIQWNVVPTAQAYYLWVGTAPGTQNLIDSGETQATQYVAFSLPAATTVYATLWTKVSGVWWPTSTTFTTSAHARWLSPTAGSVGATAGQPFRWTAVPGASAYYVWVGTTPDSSDVVNSGELSTTQYVPGSLPASTTLYATIWSKVNAVWYSRQIAFSTSPAATWVYPSENTININTDTPLEWNAVAGAEAYYLWVGTAPGGKDLVNTGEIQRTRHVASNLPAATTVYATIWTKHSGTWWPNAKIFSTASSSKWLTPSSPGGVLLAGTILQWSSVAGAQAYYLWVGTSPDAQDVVNTGETQLTQWPSTGLPKGQLLYANLWVKHADVWWPSRTTFTVLPATAQWITPSAPAVPVGQPLQWTTVPGAQAYYLWVGTAPVTQNVVNSGETPAASFPSGDLPRNTLLHATIWTKYAGVWTSAATSFTVHELTSRLLSPLDRTENFDPGTQLAWNATPSAEGYRIQIGSKPGFNDHLDSGVIQTTSFAATSLPSGRRMHARLSTRFGGVWRYVDHEFTTIPAVTKFIYPRNGQLGVSLARNFEWTPAIGADRYSLWIGTVPGEADVYSSGELTTLSHAVNALPAHAPLYGTVWSRTNGIWRSTTIVFSMQTDAVPSEFTYPADRQADVDFARAFEWHDTHFAEAYRLVIGTAPGLSDLHDSGETRVPRRFVPGLPGGPTLFAALQTRIDGQWYSRQISFAGAETGALETNMWSTAQWLAGWVREMAEHDRPYAWTLLFEAPWTWNGTVACGDFSLALLSAMTAANISLPARTLDVEFTDLDNHVLVEVFRPELNKWLMLDPTFALVVKTSSGDWASAQDLTDATRLMRWNDVSYTYLTERGAQFAEEYYLDYPVLFLNSAALARETPALYLLPEASPVSGAPWFYALQCASQATSVVAAIDGIVRAIQCGADGFTAAFPAATVETPTGHPPVNPHSFRRFVF